MDIDFSKLKDDRGRLKTNSLFLETCLTKDRKIRDALYTMKPYDHTYEGKVYPSLKKLYLEMEDPTEYMFATTYLAGWDHWKRIVNNRAFTDDIEAWREELELKLRAKGFREVLKATESEGNIGLNASKFLVDKGWKEKAGRGRPSKAEKEKQRKQDSRLVSEFEEDLNRLKRIK